MVKNAVKAWLVYFQKNKKRREEDLIKEIESLDAFANLTSLSDSKLASRSSMKAELMFLYRFKEINLIQKSKLNWMQLGDENTSFFHRLLAAKKRKNLITELVNEFRVPAKSFREIESLILEFYTELFSKSLGLRNIPINFDWPCITPQNLMLTVRFSEFEIKAAVKSLGKCKAHGLDGFITEFLIKYWNLVKPNLLSIFEEFHRNGRVD